MKGQIARIKHENGYGFIRPDDDSKDVFFHAKDCGGIFNDLKEGDNVSFDTQQTDRGLKATNIIFEM